MSGDNNTPEGVSFDDFEAYMNGAPDYDPDTGEIKQQPAPAPAPVASPVQQSAPTPLSIGTPDELNQLVQQVIAGVHATLTAVRSLEATKSKEDSVQRVGTDVMNAQELIKKVIDGIRSVHTLTANTDKRLLELENKLGGRDLDELKADLNRTVVNLNKAAEARFAGQNIKYKWPRRIFYTLAVLSLSVNIAFFAFSSSAIRANYSEEVTNQLKECAASVKRDNQAFRCSITMKP